MGIDISGGMFVGAHYLDLAEPDEDGEAFDMWAESVGLSRYGPYYDSPREECWYGFPVAPVENIRGLTPSWITAIKRLSKEFKALTGRVAIFTTAG